MASDQRLLRKLKGMTAEGKIALIKAAVNYRSGTDSVGSVYMGSLSVGRLHHVLGGSYSKDALDDLLDKATVVQLDAGLEVCLRYIKYMREHPTEKCPCCGQIVSAKKGKRQ